MKVRVDYTVTVDARYRMSLCHSWGMCGTLATRDEIKTHLELVGSSIDDDLSAEIGECDVCRAALGEEPTRG